MQLNKLCEVQRKCSKDADIGIIVGANDEWGVMARYDYCFEFDDFMLFRLCDILYCEDCGVSAYLSHVASRLNLSAPGCSFILADNITEIALRNEWIGRKELIGLYKYRDKETSIYMGHILSVAPKSFVFSEIDNEAEPDGVFRHYYKSISAISFGGGYAKMLQMMVGGGGSDEK